MSKWLRRLRGAVGMGLTWAVIWAIVGGGVMEGIVDPNGEILDMWPQTLAIPGFVGGVVFSMLLWSAEGRRRFDELSLPRFTALGSLVGLLLGVFAIATGAGGSAIPLWMKAAMFAAPMTALSALSASGTLLVARVAARRELLGGRARSDAGMLEAEELKRLADAD